jgi:hypothetical protein
MTRCEWCAARMWPAATGRPARFCDGRCRQPLPATRRGIPRAVAAPRPGRRVEATRSTLLKIHTRQ